MKIERIEHGYCKLGEGPVWDVASQTLYLLDIASRAILAYQPDGPEIRRWELPVQPGAMALRQGGGAIVAAKDTVYTLDFSSGVLDPIAVAESQPGNATFNDGKTDRQGRFVIGSCSQGMENPLPVGGLFNLQADHSLARLDDDIIFSNSPCFSPDGKTLYFADSGRYIVYAYDYDPATGLTGPRRPFASTQALGGMPDGATVDADGLVWVSIFEGAKIAAFHPRDGKLERTVDMPVKLVASVMFGGPKLDQLFVATIDPVTFGRAPEAGGGELYVIEGLGARGVPEVRYAG